MPEDLASYLDRQRRRLEGFGNFVEGVNKPKTASVAPTKEAKPVTRTSQTSALFHGVGKSSRSRHAGRLRQLKAQRQRRTKGANFGPSR